MRQISDPVSHSEINFSFEEGMIYNSHVLINEKKVTLTQ